MCLLVVPRIGHNLPKASNLIDGRIAGGSKAAKGQYPHQVSMQMKNTNNYNFCSGAIISPNWILTAAQCMDGIPSYENLVITAGINKLRGKEDTEQTVGVEKAIVHEKYKEELAAYDIALLKLSKPLTLSKYVAMINLSEAGAESKGTVVLSGWGSTSSSDDAIMPNDLQKADLAVIDFQTCKKALEKSDSASFFDERMVCTVPLTGGVSSCDGDSGGPLIDTNAINETEIVGLVSWGVLPCGLLNAPSVYTKVSSYIDWIQEKVAVN
ncbi:trypsin-1-like [Prorops nasuta]|uniref:trypsin-1-like n=1 Tax=Prorops nasuta TaxID=863751 RepID=UPI0034CD870D